MRLLGAGWWDLPVSHSHPVGATVETPVPILFSTDLGIISQSYGDFSAGDLGIKDGVKDSNPIHFL